MRSGKIYYLVSSFLLFLAAFVYLSPSFLAPDLIYPQRIDSLYLSFHAGLTQRDSAEAGDSIPENVLFNPASVNLPYENFDVKTFDGLTLHGWYVASTDTPANTILILHDLNQSKINYLDQIKQFRDRGFNVCVVDLRAHGNSGGQEFTPGIPAVQDALGMMDSLYLKPGTNHIVIMGVGLGAAIAMQVVAFKKQGEALILHNPILNLNTYVDRYAAKKWGVMKFLWTAVLRRKVESLLKYPIGLLDLSAMSALVTTPTLFMTGSDYDYSSTTEVLSMYNASPAEQKELILIDNRAHPVIEGADADIYYNRIAEFINTSLPRNIKTTHYKKLASNDQ